MRSWHSVPGLGAALAGLVLAGCGAPAHHTSPAALDWSRTRQFGVGAAYDLAPHGTAVARARPVHELRCTAGGGRHYGVHVELFADGRGILVPAGIGVAPPLRSAGPVVAGGRCAYPLRTVDPTGVVQVDPVPSPPPTLGDLFALWGQPLSENRLASFAARPGQRVVAYVNGRRWPGLPQSVPLLRHAALVIELGPHVAPHPSYAFAPGL